ncbi:MAG: hypothetical protein AABY22_09110, partial [Nanoarchaeota archaeon]
FEAGLTKFKYHMDKVEQVKIAPIIRGKQCDVAAELFMEKCSEEVGETAVPIGCYDSDGGQIFNQKGVTYGRNLDSISETFTDRCESASVLEEGYCLPSNEIETDLYTCPSGVCLGGACSN